MEFILYYLNEGSSRNLSLGGCDTILGLIISSLGFKIVSGVVVKVLPQ